MPRGRLGLLLLALLVPTAQAAVTIDALEAPAQTVADRVFDARIVLTNHGEPIDVVLVAALYDAQEGAKCGPATDPRFRAFTPLVHESIRLGRGETRAYPDPGERWSHRYARAETPATSPAEWCVFVARAPGPSAQVQYEAFRSMPLAVRATNAPPTASFTWSPTVGVAAEPMTFDAQTSDAEGDPVMLRWDFGFSNATGRAKAQGPTATVRFYPAGTYEVTLFASDGFDETRVTRTVQVEASTPAPTTVRPAQAPTPLPLWLAAGALLLAARHKQDARQDDEAPRERR